MKSEQMDKIVLPIGDNYKYVKYVYRYLAEGEEKVKKERSERSLDHFKEISRKKTPIQDSTGRYIGWIAEHLYEKI